MSSQATVTITTPTQVQLQVFGPDTPSVVTVSVTGPQGPKGDKGDTGPPSNLSIGNRTADGLDLVSDTGTDATVPAATGELAGLMTATDKLLLLGGGDESIAMAIALG